MVGAPERLVFEAAPMTEPPVVQDRAARRPVVTEGALLDTTAACRPLTIVEQAELAKLHAREQQRLAAEAKQVRDAYVGERGRELAKRTGMPLSRAMQIIASQCAGVLLPDVVLPFDDPELAGKTVADVLADPDRYEGETLADPLEGVAYGTCKARVMRCGDGSLWIHSFAHGRTIYELKLDAPAVRKLIEAAASDAVVALWLRIVTTAELDETERTALRRLVANRGDVGLHDLRQREKAIREQQAAQRERERRLQILVNRTDPRLRILVPRSDAEWLPVMNALNEVLGANQEPEPPMRDIDGAITAVRSRRIPACTC
jgi:hypothetical protein